MPKDRRATIDKLQSTINDQILTTDKQRLTFNNEPSRHQVKATRRNDPNNRSTTDTSTTRRPKTDNRRPTNDQRPTINDHFNRQKMAILSNSWAEHLKNLGGNKDTNKHMKAFTNALTLLKTIPARVNALVKDVDAGILLVGPKNSILRTHSWKRFGGTRSRPDYNIFCLIETGPIGQGVSVDIVSITSAYPISIVSATEISNRRTVLDFEGLGINVSDSRPATNAGVTLEITAAKANSQNLGEIPFLNLMPEHASGDATTAPLRRPTRRSLGEDTAEAATEQATTAAITQTSNTTAAAGRRGGRQGSRGGQGGT
jgi:hypothetical protein